MMKEDYLWNKTGNDAEIEHFERSLAHFRYRECDLAENAPRKLSPEKTFRFWRMLIPDFRTAFAASIITAFLLVGVWLNSSTISTNETAFSVSSTSSPAPVVVHRPPMDNGLASVPIVVRSTPKFSGKTERRLRNSAKSRPAVSVLPSAADSSQHGKLNLTKEEKYAYDQVMLALSITSSKLKLVKEKVSLTSANEVLSEKD